MIPFLSMSTQHIPQNREQKRKFISEYEKVKADLEPIEMKFVDMLFRNEVGLEYGDIYQHFLLSYESAIKWWNSYGKLRIVSLDPYYFRDHFKPEEQNSDNTIFFHK
jgi:hypothetical protein